jgi:hypothetical protein
MFDIYYSKKTTLVYIWAARDFDNKEYNFPDGSY